MLDVRRVLKSLIIVLFVFYAGGVSATTFQVCKDGCRLDTVQEGINRASSGDNVVITDSSVYRENLELNVSGLKLGSLNGETPQIRGEEGKAIHVTEEGVKIGSLTVRTSRDTDDDGFTDTAIHIDIDNRTPDTVVRNNRIVVEEGSDPALLVGEADGIRIIGNTITGNTSVGINLDRTENALVKNNQVDVGGRGMLVDRMQGVEIRGNEIVAEDGREEEGRAIDIRNSADALIQNNPRLTGNSAALRADSVSGIVSGNDIDGAGTGIMAMESNLEVESNSVDSAGENTLQGDRAGIAFTGTGFISQNNVTAEGVPGLAVSGRSLNIIDNRIRTSGKNAEGISLEELQGSKIDDNRIITNSRGSPGVIFQNSKGAELSNNRITVERSHPIWFDSRRPENLKHRIKESNTANGDEIVFVEGEKGVKIKDRNNFDGQKENDASVIIVANSDNVELENNGLGMDGIYLWNVENVQLHDNRIKTSFSRDLWIENAKNLEAVNTLLEGSESILLKDTAADDALFTSLNSSDGKSHFNAEIERGGLTYREESDEPAIANSFEGSGAFERNGLEAVSQELVKWRDEWSKSPSEKMRYRMKGLRPNTVYTVSYDKEAPEKHRTDSNGELSFKIESSGNHEIRVAGGANSTRDLEKNIENLNKTSEIPETDGKSGAEPERKTKLEKERGSSTEFKGFSRIMRDYTGAARVKKNVDRFTQNSNTTVQKAHILELRLENRRLRERVDRLENKVRQLNGTVPENLSVNSPDENISGNSGSTESEEGVGKAIQNFVGSIF